MLGTDVVRRPPFMQCVHQVWLDTSVDVSRALLGHITTASAMAPVMPSLLTLVDALMALQSMASNARQTPVKQVGLAHPHDTSALSLSQRSLRCGKKLCLSVKCFYSSAVLENKFEVLSLRISYSWKIFYTAL